jgi:hypothetical protein
MIWSWNLLPTTAIYIPSFIHSFSILSHDRSETSSTTIPPLSARKYSWYSFLLEAESTQIHRAAERIMSMKYSNDTIGNRTRDLPTCNLNQLRHRTPPPPPSGINCNRMALIKIVNTILNLREWTASRRNHEEDSSTGGAGKSLARPTP